MEQHLWLEPKRGKVPWQMHFDCIGPDDKFGQQTWEAAESSLQKEALTACPRESRSKAGRYEVSVCRRSAWTADCLIIWIKTFEIPLFGLYGACSTCGEALALSAMTVAAGYADRVAAVTSSHFASAEKQFRFPLEYANQRPVSATWTVTGGGAFILSKDAKQPLAKVAGVTTGKIVDYGIKDSMNMGAVMAPAAAELIAQNLTDFKRKPEDYDRIITGDLGEVGQQILFDLLLKKGMDIRKQHEDCGMLIFDSQTQGTGSGGSGCGCAASVLSAHFLPKLASGELKRILFVPTGALLSTVSFNEGQTIPGIAHGVVLESCISSAKRRDKDMQYVIAFVTGGMICALSQILMEKQNASGAYHGSFGLPWSHPWICGGSMSRFPNGRRRARMCRFWDLETISGRVSKRWWTRKDLSVFFWAALKTVRQGFPQHSFFPYIASLLCQPKMKKH